MENDEHDEVYGLVQIYWHEIEVYRLIDENDDYQ